MLNEKQKKLVEAHKGKILCLAGAGSGKTHCIVEKIKYAILENGMSPSGILALTFTKKAAHEMRERIARNLGAAIGELVGAFTLNSFCYQKVVKVDPSYFGYTQKTLKVVSDYNTILKDTIADKDKVFIENVAQELEYYLSRNRPLPSSAFIEDSKGVGHEIDLNVLFADMRCYQFEHNLITFTDQIIFAYQRLRDDIEFRNRTAVQYTFIIVDEAQDNNFMQNNIVLMLGSAHNNITAVGDDAQSMYRFRGADPSFFLSLKDNHDFSLYTLTTNYRSNQPILDLGNSILQPNFEAEVQVEKYLIAHNPIQAAKPKLNVFFKPKQQTAFLVTSIIRQLAEGKKPKEIAVLARTIKGASVCRYLPAALRENDIPYKVVGGFDVMNSIHIKNMLSVFYLALGNTDLANWITALLIFPDIGEVRSKQIAKCVPDWDKAKIPKASANSIKEFRCLISKIAESTSDAHDCFLKFYRWYADLIDEHYTVDHRHGYTHRQRGEIDDLFNYIEGTFEQHTDLAEAVDILVMDIDDEDINEDAVTISSIHRAKGLEWSVVYIPDCVATMYPHKMCTKLEDKQEELRIFHVAVTRARDELYLTADLTPIRESRPYLSPFLDLRYVTAPNPRIIEWYTLDAKSFWRNAKLRDEAEKENESGGA